MIWQHTLKIATTQGVTITDLTDQLNKIIEHSNSSAGMCVVYIQHTTAGLRINENETGLIQDSVVFLNTLASQAHIYYHDDLTKRDVPSDEPKNAHAHLKSLVLNTSECIPFANKKLLLGKWQRIFCIDSDGPRERSIHITILGA